MRQLDQLAVVGGHELVEHPRRNHRRGGRAAAKLENVVAGPRQRFDEHLLPPKQNAQQFVNPGRVVVGLHDQPLDAHQAGRVLPGAGLAENVEAADVRPHQPPLAERLDDAVDLLDVAFRSRHDIGRSNRCRVSP